MHAHVICNPLLVVVCVAVAVVGVGFVGLKRGGGSRRRWDLGFEVVGRSVNL